jgi:hypothetical protein
MKFKFNFYFKDTLNRIISIVVLLTTISTVIPAQTLPGYGDIMPKGFDPSAMDFHFSRADREITAERWMEEAKNGIYQAQIAWERIAFELYSDPAEFAAAKNALTILNTDELEKHFARWVVKCFLGNEYSSTIEDMASKIKNADMRLLFNLDDYGNVVFDENTGDPLIIRPNERDLLQDLEARRDLIDMYVTDGLSKYETGIESFYPELLNYIDEENRSSFMEKLKHLSIETSDSLKRDMVELSKREEQLFIARRTGDIFSLRKKSDSEAAEFISAELIVAAEKICDEGIASIETRIEQARAGTGELVIAGEEWLLAYQEQFGRGLNAWEEAEERFLVRRIEWEQETGKLYSESEEAWEIAFSRLSEEKEAWELKSKALFEQGEKMFENASSVLQNAIKEARIEFERDAALRLQSGMERAGAWINIYITSGGIVASAQENVDFWLLDWGENAKNAPKLLSGQFASWLNNEILKEKNELNNILLSITQKNNAVIELEDTTKNLDELEQLRLDIENLNERKAALENLENMKSELKKWSEIYNKYLTIATQARDALVNEFSLVIGSGTLADVLSNDLSTEYFNLDEYQIELVRAAAVASYWEKRVNIAKEVNKYSAELSAGRITDAEGVKLWENAKSEYDEALLIYENSYKKLSESGAEITSIKQELSAASAILQDIDSKLSNEFSVLAGMRSAGNEDIVMLELIEKYKELIKQNNLYKIDGNDAIYINYIERARELDYHNYLETNGEILKEIVTGNMSGSKSLSELYTEYDNIWIPENTNVISSNIEAYHISEDNNYYSVISRLLYERNQIINSGDKFEDNNELLEECDYLVITAVNAAKNSVKRQYDGRISALNLLTASSTNEWYKSEYGITDEVIFEYGVGYQLTIDAAIDKEELTTAVNILLEQNYPEYICYILLDDLVSKSDLSQNLLAAYRQTQNISTAIIEEENSLALKNMRELFLAYGIETDGYSLPSVKLTAEILFRSGDDAVESTVNFLYALNSCFLRMPSWIKNEAEKWEMVFIEYFAARSIYYNRYSQISKNDIINRYEICINAIEDDEKLVEQYSGEIEYLWYMFQILDEIEKQQSLIQTANANKEKHWREYITDSFLNNYNKTAQGDDKVATGIKGNPESNSPIKAASNYIEGYFTDKFENAEYETKKLNDAIYRNINLPTEKISDTIAEIIDKYISNRNAEWSENDIFKIERTYKDRLNAEIAYLNKMGLLKSALSEEITRLGGMYEKAAADTKMQDEINRIEAKIKSLEYDYNTAKNNYSKATDKFAEKGNAYDILYTQNKNNYDKLEAARFEYEKQDAVRKWASTVYLEYDGTDDIFTEQYKNPINELNYSIEKFERSKIILSALKDVYNNGETRRPFNNIVYNDLYEQYKQSFERLVLSIKLKNELDAAVREEMSKNEQLYSSYTNNIQALGYPINININDTYVSPADKSEWNLTDIITVKNGKLAFFYDFDNFSLQGQTKESANILNSYFSLESKNGNETRLSTEYELSLRKLNDFLQLTMLDEGKYRQWSLARDYLISQLQRNNSEVDILYSYYSRDTSLSSGDLSSKYAVYEELKFDDISDVNMPDSKLFNIQMNAWNELSSREKEYLEFYTILTLTGAGGLDSKGFKFETWATEYNDVRDTVYDSKKSADKTADNLIILSLCTSVFVLPVTILALAASILAFQDAADKLSETLNELDKSLDNYNRMVSEGFSGLTITSDSIKESYKKYKASCDRLEKLKGGIKENIVWADIDIALKTAGTIDASEIAKLKKYWTEMNSDTSIKSGDVLEALSAIVQWGRGEREDIKRDLELEFSNEDEDRIENQKIYRDLSQLYIDGAENMDSVSKALYAAYGKNAPAIKNHLENIESALMNNVSGVMTSGSSYMIEYFSLSAEIIDVIGRAYQTRYAAELAAREVEWEQQIYDINQKMKSWRGAAEVILAKGREDWKKGAENMRIKYSNWVKEFKDEYQKTSDIWDGAYLMGLEDKTAWAVNATETANTAASIATLDLMGVDAEQKARMMDTRDPRYSGMANGTLAAEKSLNEILSSAGILNTADALDAASHSAQTSASAARTGLGGMNVWSAGSIQLKAVELAKAANEEIAAREAKIIAANVRRIAINMSDDLKNYVNEANKNFDENMDETFIISGRWSRSGKNYINDILVSASAISGGKREKVAVETYHYYEMEIIILKTDLSEERLLTLESFAIQAIIKEMGDELKTIQDSIFGSEKENAAFNNKSGDAKRFQSQPGKFGKHIGYEPKTKDRPEIDIDTISENKIFDHKGEGELGRLMTKYIYWKYKESLGFDVMNSAMWDKPLWDSYGSAFKAPSIRDISEIAMQAVSTIAAAVVTPFTGGASLLAYAAMTTAINMADDAVFAALDVSGGYKDGADVGVAFAKKATVTFASSLVNSAFGGLNVNGVEKFKGLTEQFTSGIGNGFLQTAAKTGMAGLQTATTGTIANTINAVTYNKDGGFGFSTDAFLAGMSNSGINSITATATSLTNGILGRVNLFDGIDQELNGTIFNTQGISKLNSTIGAIAGEAVSYGLTGEYIFNLANLSALTADEVNMGLLELHLGENGTSLNLGAGGVDVSIGSLGLAASGLRDAMKIGWAKFASPFDRSKGISVLNSVNGLANTNDMDNNSIAAAIWQDELDVEFIDMFDIGYYDKMENPDTIFLNSSLLGNNKEKVLELTSVLAHEGTHVLGNDVESLAYLKAYATYLTLAKNYNLKIDTDFVAEIQQRILDPKSQIRNTGNKQFWKLTSYGLIYDGDGYLRNENGEYYYKDKTFGKELDASKVAGSKGVESGLLDILGIFETGDPSHDAVTLRAIQQMMEESGIKHSTGNNNKNWYWSGVHETENGEENLTDKNMGVLIRGNRLARFGMVNLGKLNYSQEQIASGQRIYDAGVIVFPQPDLQPGWPDYFEEQRLRAEALANGTVYVPRPGDAPGVTWCNRAAQRIMAIVLGQDYVDKYLLNYEKEASANTMGNTLKNIFNNGSINALNAQISSNMGNYIVASWINPVDKGHIATVVPDYGWFIPGIGPKVAQSGSTVGITSVRNGFGRDNMKSVDYYNIENITIHYKFQQTSM